MVRGMVSSHKDSTQVCTREGRKACQWVIMAEWWRQCMVEGAGPKVMVVPKVTWRAEEGEGRMTGR